MRASILVLLAMLLFGAGAAAQTRAPDAPAEATQPPLGRKACAEHNLQGQGDTHETQGRASPEGSLGEKLAQSGGVICPPEGLDPDIRAPAPNGGRTPVIPPPSPGAGPPAQQN